MKFFSHFQNYNYQIIDYFPDHYDELVNAEAETFPMFWDDPLVNHPILETIIAPKLISGAIERTATRMSLMLCLCLTSYHYFRVIQRSGSTESVEEQKV